MSDFLLSGLEKDACPVCGGKTQDHCSGLRSAAKTIAAERLKAAEQARVEYERGWRDGTKAALVEIEDQLTELSGHEEEPALFVSGERFALRTIQDNLSAALSPPQPSEPQPVEDDAQRFANLEGDYAPMAGKVPPIANPGTVSEEPRPPFGCASCHGITLRCDPACDCACHPKAAPAAKPDDVMASKARSQRIRAEHAVGHPLPPFPGEPQDGECIDIATKPDDTGGPAPKMNADEMLCVECRLVRPKHAGSAYGCRDCWLAAQEVKPEPWRCCMCGVVSDAASVNLGICDVCFDKIDVEKAYARMLGRPRPLPNEERLYSNDSSAQEAKKSSEPQFSHGAVHGPLLPPLVGKPEPARSVHSAKANHEFEDALELAYWRFDNISKNGEVLHGTRCHGSERDAYKKTVRELRAIFAPTLSDEAREAVAQWRGLDMICRDAVFVTLTEASGVPSHDLALELLRALANEVK